MRFSHVCDSYGVEFVRCDHSIIYGTCIYLLKENLSAQRLFLLRSISSVLSVGML